VKFEVGQHLHCPTCGNRRAQIVWISEDGKTIGVKCPTSGHQHKKDAVTLVDVEE